MAQGSKDVVKTNPVTKKPEIVAESRYLNERSIADLLAIRQTMIDKKIWVDDLQFLIGTDGRVVITDIRGFSIGISPSSVNKRTIDRLIEAAKRNIAP